MITALRKSFQCLLLTILKKSRQCLLLSDMEILPKLRHRHNNKTKIGDYFNRPKNICFQGIVFKRHYSNLMWKKGPVHLLSIPE